MRSQASTNFRGPQGSSPMASHASGFLLGFSFTLTGEAAAAAAVSFSASSPFSVLSFCLLLITLAGSCAPATQLSAYLSLEVGRFLRTSGWQLSAYLFDFKTLMMSPYGASLVSI